MWRNQKRRQRKAKKDIENALTPPNSPMNDENDAEQPQPQISHQKAQSIRKWNRQKSKCYRDLAILEKKLTNATRQVDMYKKRLDTMKIDAESHRKKTRRLLRLFPRKQTETIRKTLNVHFAIIKQMREKYKKRKSKLMVDCAVIGRVTRKYKITNHLREELGMYCNTKTRTKHGTKVIRLTKQVQAFFQRDDNPRMTTGIKRTLTKNKIKHQKRLMLDTLRNLYSKFEAENSELADKVHDELWLKYRKHSYTIQNQFSHYKTTNESLQTTECFIHIDFAENYVTKLSQEIQSKHFGASQMQISLHTGYYITGQMDTIQLFCGVSNSLQHDPVSVWAYLHHILVKIKEEFPSVDPLHFFSVTGHGKGIPDGIGAALKRSADVRVKHGSDIENTKNFVRQIKASGSRVYVYEIQKHIKSTESKILNKQLKTVPGTMNIHKVITNQPGEIAHRLVSCTCKEKICNGHELSHFTFSSKADAETSARKDENANDVQDNDVKSKQDTHKKDYDKKKVRKKKCQDFEELKSKCLDITSQIDDIEGHQRSNRGFMADLVSDRYTPNKQKENGNKAIKVRVDGDCLPATGSVFAFGSDRHPIEIRTRIILEQVMQQDKYLDARIRQC
ncbi:unnamed protein product [Mytilus coruscus]|uniref:Uncharacterized protein n=1 Tax=Mytilus coruscus TaxID=42192 RepID=A0A6J8BE91_MYTCO|nr:unnamed protein product [Mytilus coruscus]